jgi:PAS domain S-box-containing protein
MEKVDNSGSNRLHQKADDLLKKNLSESSSQTSGSEILRIIQELEIKKTALELEIEQLRYMQEDIELSRIRYYDFFNLAPIGYFTIDENGKIIIANQKAATMLNLPHSELVKKRITQIIPEQFKDYYNLYSQLLFETGEQQVCELQMPGTDGGYFWARMEASRARDADGNPVCFVVMSNISKQINAEEKVRKNLEELQRWQEVTLGREDRNRQLKNEVNELCIKLGGPIRYPSQENQSGL